MNVKYRDEGVHRVLLFTRYNRDKWSLEKKGSIKPDHTRVESSIIESKHR